MTPQDTPASTLESLRPSQDRLEAQWPQLARNSTLENIILSKKGPEAAAATGPSQVRRRPALLMIAVAGAATILVVASGVLPTGAPGLSSADAATLNRLATAAGSTPADLVPPGEYKHFVFRTDATFETASGTTHPPVLRTDLWVDSNGASWRRETEQNGSAHRYHFAPSTESNANNPSPTFLASLPTDSDELYRYLRDHAHGSSSTDEAVLVAVGDLLRTQMASPELRAAAVRVLGHLPITIEQHATSASGQRGTLISMERPRNQGTEALLVDDGTSLVVEERNTNVYSRPVNPDTARALSTTQTLLSVDTAPQLPPDMRSVI